MEKTYDITLLRPGGNDTALVKGIISPAEKKLVNDAIQRKYPNIEQVGFYEWDEKTKSGSLEMAGGEFCGNATRSSAYLFLNGKIGTVNIIVSGLINRKLVAGVNENNTAFTEIPIFSSFSSVTQISDSITQVDIDGITHLITKRPLMKNSEELKRTGKKLLKKYNLLLSKPCAGVMYLSTKDGKLFIDPIVWIRDIKTLFYETACASGTTAIGLWKTKRSKEKKTTLGVLQPSGETLTVTVVKNTKEFTQAFIEGPIATLQKGARI